MEPQIAVVLQCQGTFLHVVFIYVHPVEICIASSISSHVEWHAWDCRNIQSYSCKMVSFTALWEETRTAKFVCHAGPSNSWKQQARTQSHTTSLPVHKHQCKRSEYDILRNCINDICLLSDTKFHEILQGLHISLGLTPRWLRKPMSLDKFNHLCSALELTCFEIHRNHRNAELVYKATRQLAAHQHLISPDAHCVESTMDLQPKDL